MRMLRISLVILAFACFAGALYAQDEVADALYGEGLRNYVLKDYKAALKNFEGLYQLNPNDVKNREMLANTLLALGDAAFDDEDYGKAETYYLKAKGISPANTESQNRLDIVRAAWDRQIDLARETAESSAESGQAGSSQNPQPSTGQIPIIIQTPPSEESGAILALLERVLSSQEGAQDNMEGDLRRLSDQQNNDRDLFLRTILIGIGIFLAATLVIVVVVLLVVRSRRTNVSSNQPEPAMNQGKYLALTIDDGDYLTDERHSDIIRARRLTELAGKLNRGEDSWETIQDYVGELSIELKDEILSSVEKKLQSSSKPENDNVMSVLLPLVTDSDENLGSRSQNILTSLSEETERSYSAAISDCPDTDDDPLDPLSYNSILQLARLVDSKTGRPEHSVMVGNLSREIAQRLNLPSLNPEFVRKVGLGFDIGFLEISDEVMKKDGPLNEEEFAIMRSHTDRGPELLEHANPPEDFIIGMTMHHERLDGSGYPRGRSGDDIPMIARIIAVADMFCAATADRPYHKPLSVEACLEIMKGLSGTQLDVDVVNILLDIFEDRGDNK